MQLKESGEMYLETIYVLSKKSNYIRSIDVCEEMGYSKPSVSRAVGLLKEGGYLKVGNDGSLILTDLGREIAEKHMKDTPFFQSSLLCSELIPKLPPQMPAKWNTLSATKPLPH